MFVGSLGEEELGEILNLYLTLVIQLAVADNFFNLRRQELLALLFSHLDHLIAEHTHIHLCLQFTVATGSIICDQAERFDQILQRVLLLVSTGDQRAKRVLIERAAALRVYIADHLCHLGFAWVEVEAANDRTQVICLHETIGILVEQTEDFADLGDHHVG